MLQVVVKAVVKVVVKVAVAHALTAHFKFYISNYN